MRRVPLAPGEYYHVVNRGISKQKLFLDTRDYARFLFLILYLQSPMVFTNIGRYVSSFVKHRMFNISEDDQREINDTRIIYLHAFCIMPNHFHLILSEVEEGGISRYLQRIQNGYGKYFNTRYTKNGHVFQGSFRSVHMSSNEQLLHTSAYIHKNPCFIIPKGQGVEKYQWSSYADYVQENRWQKLLDPSIILDQFKTKKEYYDFVRTNTAKEYVCATSDVEHFLGVIPRKEKSGVDVPHRFGNFYSARLRQGD